jgi:hypothetical protein
MWRRTLKCIFSFVRYPTVQKLGVKRAPGDSNPRSLAPVRVALATGLVESLCTERSSARFDITLRRGVVLSEESSDFRQSSSQAGNELWIRPKLTLIERGVWGKTKGSSLGFDRRSCGARGGAGAPGKERNARW